MSEQRAFVGLGSNLRSPERQILLAFDELARLPESRLAGRSSLYKTAPVGYADQPDFVNAVAELWTRLSAMNLLDALLEIEQRHGRVRETPNGPRTLDLDVLLFGDHQVRSEGLHVPHPRAHERAFVLHPLIELAPDVAIPGRGPAKDWLAQCADQPISRIAEESTLRRALGTFAETI
ncbi:MAG: 2-amino-4-hydroxy-6-hydroxymethyldihydropteridine diphosphokinase [Candidatus Methylophosphatis roskildensis]